MQVTWLQDQPLGVGGAASTDEQIIFEGFRRGHEIHSCLPKTEIPRGDLYVISNATRFPMDALLELQPRTVFLHDFSPLCDHRLYFPMQLKCRECKNRAYTLKLLQGSELTCFMSKLHRDAWLSALPELEEIPYELIPSALSKSRVEQLVGVQESQPESDTVLGVNCLYGFKGRKRVLKYARDNPELRFTFVGGREELRDLPGNCRYVGILTWSRLLEMYASRESVIHLPFIDPCSRVVVEAILSGCKLIHNRAIGLLSYFDFKIPDPDEVKELVLDSPKRFWRKVEEVIK